MNGSDYLPLRPGLKTPALVEVAAILEREGVDAIEVSVGHYESGMPMVRGTFWRCLRNMLQGSMRHLPLVRRTLLRVSWPLLRSEEHTSELQSLMRISYAVFCLTKKKKYKHKH